MFSKICRINLLFSDTSHRSTGVKVAIGLVITLAITNAIAIVIWLCRRRIINHVANVRARHIQHYSTQRNEDTSQDWRDNLNYPTVGHDQGSARYIAAHSRVTSDEDINNVTGIANQSYCEDNVRHVTNTALNTNKCANNAESPNEGFI